MTIAVTSTMYRHCVMSCC